MTSVSDNRVRLVDLQNADGGKARGCGPALQRISTTALCSPTRTALLTGRNHHVNNAGAIMELATAFPGNYWHPATKCGAGRGDVTIKWLQHCAFGKYHETPPWEVSVSGPYDRWPPIPVSTSSTDFIAASESMGAAIFDGTIRVEPPHDPNYHFTVDMTNRRLPGCSPAFVNSR